MASYSDAEIEVLTPPRGLIQQARDSVGADERIGTILRRIKGPDDFAALLTSVNARGDDRVITSGGLFATLAVRRQSSEDIHLGLLANALAYGNTTDWRDILADLALLFRAAELIGDDPVVAFLSAANVVGATPTKWDDNANEWLISFANRKIENRSLEAFHYAEHHDEHGVFHFRRIEELCRRLIEVIPLEKSRVFGSATVSLVRLERYTDGFLVMFRYWTESGEQLPILRYHWQATDDKGNRYTRSGTLSENTPMHSRDRTVDRKTVLFTPQLAPNAAWLALSLPSVQRMDWIRDGSAITGVTYTNMPVGPWSFKIAIPSEQSPDAPTNP